MGEPAHREIAACDAVCSMLFAFLDSFPRLKDKVVDPLIAESLAPPADKAAEGGDQPATAALADGAAPCFRATAAR